MLNKKLKKITTLLIVLLVITLAVGYFYYERNIFWQDEVRFEIIASESIEMGKITEYKIRYKNNSDVRLEDMTLVFEYPHNVVPIEDEENSEIIKRGELRREIKIGELNPGQEKITTFKVRPLGKEGDTLEASAWISYIPRNLTAKYEMERNHTATINSVPIDLSFQMSSTVDPDIEESIRILFSSDIDYPLTDLEIRLNYPSLFEFVRSTPSTNAEQKDRWSWSVLNKGEDGAIDIDGFIKGDPGDSKVFTAVLGTWSNDRFIPLKETSKGTSISESHILIDILINGKEEYIANPKEFVQYEIFFRNLGKETIENLFLLVNLDKDSMDLGKVEPIKGRFQPDRDVIIWSHVFEPDLQSLREGEEGRVEFWVEVSDDLQYKPEMTIRASMEKARNDLTVKVNTLLDFSQNVVLEETPEENYVIIWEIESLFNDIEDIKLDTRLPQGAQIVTQEIGDNAEFSFNSISGNLQISIDQLDAKEKREMFIEIEGVLHDEIERDYILAYDAQVLAKDKHTKQIVSAFATETLIDEFMEEEIEKETE